MTVDPDWLGGARHVAISGLQWGDEGKGKIVDRVADRFDLVVRYNGGANAGHTVVAGGITHALHLVPCGILHPGTQNVIGNGVVIDPAGLVDEIERLAASGVDVRDRLAISDRAHVVMAYHRIEDALLERAADVVEADRFGHIGTTGRGIGPCYADKALRSTAIRISDLLDRERTRAALERIVAIKNAKLAGLAALVGEPWEPLDAERIAGDCAEAMAVLAPLVSDTALLLADARRSGKRMLFEGANAVLLDVDHGTYPFVTSSSTSAAGIWSGSGMPAGDVDEIVGVVKAYQTRVGAGPMPTELDDPIGQRLRERGREYGTTTGRPRRCGWLDLVALEHAVRISGATRLALMLLDVLSGLDELHVCTAYRIGGRTVDRLPASAADLFAAEPIYERLPGFQDDISGCRRFEDLPEAARRYVQTISDRVGLPVTLVSVGPEREATIGLA